MLVVSTIFSPEVLNVIGQRYEIWLHAPMEHACRLPVRSPILARVLAQASPHETLKMRAKPHAPNTTDSVSSAHAHSRPKQTSHAYQQPMAEVLRGMLAIAGQRVWVCADATQPPGSRADGRSSSSGCSQSPTLTDMSGVQARLTP